MRMRVIFLCAQHAIFGIGLPFCTSVNPERGEGSVSVCLLMSSPNASIPQAFKSYTFIHSVIYLYMF